MIMEWMPGDQLRRVLPSLSPEDAHELCRDWGCCVARFHHARVPGMVQVRGDNFLNWLHQHSTESIARLRTDPRWADLHGIELNGFISGRLDALRSPAALGLVKKDQDVRDFLAVPGPRPHISAMVDWEKVELGDTTYELSLIYFRMQLLGIGSYWPSFREAYEAESGARLPHGPQMECYLMMRTVIAAGLNPELHNPITNILNNILEGRSI